MTADRPTTGPRTEAGRRMLRRRSYWSGNNAIREAILAIETEAAAQGAAPRAEGLDVAIAALEQIKREEGKVCDQYEICEHRACQSSYGAWAIADATLRRLSRPSVQGAAPPPHYPNVPGKQHVLPKPTQPRPKPAPPPPGAAPRAEGPPEGHVIGDRFVSDESFDAAIPAPRAEGLPSVEALTAALAYADRTDDDPSRWYSGEVGYMDYEDHARAVLVGLSVYKDRQDEDNPRDTAA